MRRSFLVIAVVVASGLFAGPALLEQVAGPYEAVDGWLEPFAEDGYAFGSPTGVFAESPDRIFVVQRGEIRLPDPVPDGFTGYVGSIGLNALEAGENRVWRNSIFVVDGDGSLIDAWTQWDEMFEGGAGPHKIKINPFESGSEGLGGRRDQPPGARLLQRRLRAGDVARGRRPG